MITEQEFLERRTNLQKSIAQHGASHFVATSSDSIFYLCGASFDALERPFFFIVPRQGEPRLIVPFLERDHLKKAKALSHDLIFTYWDFPAPVDRSWETVLERCGGLGGDFLFDSACPMSVASTLLAFGGRQAPLIELQRRVKSPAEIALIRRSATFADRGVMELFNCAYQGVTVAEGFARTSWLTQHIVRETPDWDPLTTKVLMVSFPAPWSAMPHSVPNAVAAHERGPHVALVLTRVNAYAAESERTYFTSPPNAQEHDMFSLMVAARNAGLSMLRPGVQCAAVDATVNQFLAVRGFNEPQQRLHRVGHGFGLGNHEGPWLSEGSADVLEENMVVSIEPGIYLDAIGGYRHSDTILITRDGYELLTHAPGIEKPLVFGKKTLRKRLFRHMVSRAMGRQF
jgi:Xaa-Pro dipeptidase